MTVWEAALWGIAGGGAAGLAGLMAAIVGDDFRWPSPWQRGPRLFVLGCGVVLGALVAAASHGQMSGPWPAFIIGVGAPATVRGLLGGVEVTPRSAIPLQGLDVASPSAPIVRDPEPRTESERK